MSKTWVLIATILGSSMSFVDASAVNVALPIMQRDLAASSAQVQWVVEGYALFLAALVLVGGSLGDLFGRKKMFVLGVVIFAVASGACAMAPSIGFLIVARCIQGIGGALSVPESLALISAAFTGDERGKAIGTWSGFASITGAAGPLIGGVLTEHASWRWVFVINIPIAIAVVLIAATRVPESKDDKAVRAIDWSGAALATAGLGTLVYGLIRLQTSRSDRIGLAAAVVGVIILGVFGYAQMRARHPMMPLALFRSRAFSVANVYTFLIYMALGGSLYFFPFVLIDVHKYTPTAAGAAGLPFVILVFLLSRWSGGLIPWLGARLPLVVGGGLTGVAFLLYSLPGIGGAYWTTYFPAVCMLGIGASFFVAPLTTTVFDSSDPSQSGIASAINNAISRTSGLIAIALLGIVLSTVFDRGFDARIAARHVSPATVKVLSAERDQLTPGIVPANIPAVDRAPVEIALATGYLAGYRAVMYASAGISFGAALIALLFLPGKARAGGSGLPANASVKLSTVANAQSTR
jgi:EmrB/QacA subfamily drug resistance transporter